MKKTKQNKIIKNLPFNLFQYILIAIGLVGCAIYLILFYIFNKEPSNDINEKINYFMPIVSVFAALTNLFCVILLALKKESNFIFGAIAVILFAIIGYFTKNWFYVVLNGLYYLPFNILGYFQWKNNKKGSNSNELKVKKMNTNIFLSLLSGVILCGVAISFVFYIPFVRTWLNDKSPTNEPVYWIKLILNGLVLILSVVAMQLVIRAYQEQWRFWLIANVCMLILWATNIWDGISNNNLQYTFVSAFTLFTYTFSFANSVYGYISWKEKK